MEGTALDELVESIKANGLRHSILLYQGKIVDGRNRYIACQKAGVKPLFIYWEGDEKGLIEFIVDENKVRRQMSESDCAMVGGRLANLKKGRPQNINPPDGGFTEPLISQTEAAKLTGSSVRGIQRAKTVLDKGTKELIDAVDEREISVTKASKLAKLCSEEQKRAVKAIKESKTKKAAPKAKKEPKEPAPIETKLAISDDKNLWAVRLGASFEEVKAD